MQHRAWFWWLVAAWTVGVILAVVSINLGNIGASAINTNLIDGNLRNMTTLGKGLGSFLWQRWSSVFWFGAVCMGLVNLGRLGAGGLFIVVGVQGYWVLMSGWWTWCYYGITAIPLLMFYVCFWLIFSVFLILLIIAILQLKTVNFRCFWWFLAIFSVLALLLGLTEYAFFRVILGRIVYKVR